jgi:hypothetical protein
MNIFEELRAKRRADIFKGKDTIPIGHRADPDWGATLSPAEASRQAIIACRRVLSSLPFPSHPYINFVKDATRNVQHHMAALGMQPTDTVIMLQMRCRTASATHIEADIPVVIRSGQVVDPGTMLVNGSPVVLAPSSIAALVQRYSIHENPHRQSPYSVPQTAQEARRSPMVEMTWARPSRGMFASRHGQDALRAALTGDASFDTRQAQMTEAVQLLDDWSLPAPSTDAEMQSMLDKLSQDHGIDPVDALDAIDIVYEIWQDHSRTAARAPVAAGNVKLQLLPVMQSGNRLIGRVRFDEDQARDLSDGYLMAVSRSYLLSQIASRGLGFIGGVRVDRIDRNAGIVTISFASSTISAPSYAGAGYRVASGPVSLDRIKAALGPSQEDTDIDPAERERDFQAMGAVGDTVALTKGFEVKNRGGGTIKLDKGATGLVVKDVFGDGLHLAIAFEQGTFTVPSEYIKESKEKKAARVAAAPGPSMDDMVSRVRAMRGAGYGPVDAIVTLRREYQGAAEAAIERCAGLGLLLSDGAS